MHRLDIGRTRFRELVGSALAAAPTLPLVHGSDVFKFLNAVDDRALQPQPCDVFTGESLLYFFYGRPSYRPNGTAEPTTLAHYLPVLLILRTNLAATARRILPFDSGAFDRGFYSAHIHCDMTLGDFGLDIDADTPAKVISTFFGDPPAYLRADPRPSPDLPPEQLEAVSYRSIVAAKDANSLDSRGAAIEVQTAAPLLLAEHVQAVILPAPFADRGTTAAKLAALGIQIIPYMVHGRARPGEYVTTITDLCYRYYVEIGLFEPGEIDAGPR